MAEEDSFLTKWERVIKQTMPLEGHVMAPEPEWERHAASIICGHPYINKDWPEEKMLEFERFIREVLQTNAPPHF